MIPPARRSAAGRPLVVLALAVTTVLATACAAPPQETGPPTGSRIDGPEWSQGPLTEPRRAPKPGELEWYLDRLPGFDPAPTPEPVWLSRYEGQTALVGAIPTSQPVAFLTIDDGAVRHPMALELIQAAKVPVTLFLTTNYVTGNEAWFAALRDTGYVTIQNHTVSHPNLKTGGYEVARDQLCAANDRLAAAFGQRPTYFRPPYGEYDGTTLAAAWACGLQAGFHWRETVDAGTVYYQRDHGRIHAGDIILMHFRPAFPDDFVAALQAIKNSGLVPARLEDYVRVGEGMPPPPPPEP
ncbi:MAG: polysaccharide deacetylase family protein [Micromonosporaceae bacterium]|nr:polysaccharide deacetylase family protein [Micromonosporaceae bacterium]